MFPKPSGSFLFLVGVLFISLFIYLVRGGFQAQTKGGMQMVATTSMIGDIVKNIVQDKGEVKVLMGAGVDPHTYEATVQDAHALHQADLVFYNGLHLEGPLTTSLELLTKRRKAYPASEALAPSDILRSEKHSAAKDPHIWFDVQLWIKVTRYINEKIKDFDPLNKDFYDANMKLYVAQLEAIDREIREKLRWLPADQRVLITSHDAFGYFGRAYDIEVKALQGISTSLEPNLRQRKELREFICNRKIKAIFPEASVNHKGIEAIQQDCKNRGHEVVCWELFSDTLGARDTEEGTYVGMMRHNINTLVQGLLHGKKRQAPVAANKSNNVRPRPRKNNSKHDRT